MLNYCIKHAECPKEDEEYLICSKPNMMVRSDLQKMDKDHLEQLMSDSYAFCFSFYKDDKVDYSKAEQKKGLEFLNM
jgi:hypothetical protein